MNEEEKINLSFQFFLQNPSATETDYLGYMNGYGVDGSVLVSQYTTYLFNFGYIQTQDFVSMRDWVVSIPLDKFNNIKTMLLKAFFEESERQKKLQEFGKQKSVIENDISVLNTKLSEIETVLGKQTDMIVLEALTEYKKTISNELISLNDRLIELELELSRL